MTHNNDAALTGEEKLKARRGKFWRYVTIAVLLSFAAGLGTGYLSGMFEDGTLPSWVLLTALAVAVAGFAWFTRDYFLRIDELDLMDNLWSHLVGYYVAIWTFGTWYLLYDVGKASEPTALPIVLVMVVITFIAYGVRKLGLR